MAAGGLVPEFEDVSVAGGALSVASFGSGERLVLGIHGITGSCMQLAPVARRLGEAFRLVAPDLRGRGGSNGLPPPFGVRSHAADCAAVIEHVSSGPVTVLGESLGAFVAVVLAGTRPELVERLVLADGGLPTEVPRGMDTDELLKAVIGPAIDRLDQVFASEQAYLEFWRAHPAVGEEWNADVEAYLAYDLEPAHGDGYVSRAQKDAVRADGGDVLADTSVIAGSLRQITCPIVLVRAARNLVNGLPPLYPEESVAPWRQLLADFEDELVEDTNHYTLMFGDRGASVLSERVAAAPGRAAAAEGA